MVFRVYIANILLLLLLLTVSQVRCASAPVYSHQLIKFELLTQSIRQHSCQNICMEDSVPLFSIHLYYNTSFPGSSIANCLKFMRLYRGSIGNGISSKDSSLPIVICISHRTAPISSLPKASAQLPEAQSRSRAG